jgi:arsenate reductase-like glutaredoxin family protein
MEECVLQVIGTKKCPATRKSIRFCKEHLIQFQFVDLGARNLSDGEWNNIFQAINPKSLIDEKSAFYKKEGYAWRSYDPEEELRLRPQLLKTPLLRCKRKVVIGHDVTFLQTFQESL